MKKPYFMVKATSGQGAVLAFDAFEYKRAEDGAWFFRDHEGQLVAFFSLGWSFTFDLMKARKNTTTK